jgi:exodeoxyribonuclease VII small subunit
MINKKDLYMPAVKPKTKTEPPEVKDLSYEQALAELESIVTSLESAKLPLNETMALYERGQALTKHCVELLDKAELKVKKLSGESIVDIPAEQG